MSLRQRLRCLLGVHSHAIYHHSELDISWEMCQHCWTPLTDHDAEKLQEYKDYKNRKTWER